MYLISPELKAFVESGVAVVVGTGDAAGRPHVVFGWGPRVLRGRKQIDVFVDTVRSRETLANLYATGGVAMTVGDPVSYRSVQLKGRFRDSGEPDEAERAWVERHRDAFLIAASLVGDPPAAVTNLWVGDVVRIRFAVEGAFDQTPGAVAGGPL